MTLSGKTWSVGEALGSEHRTDHNGLLGAFNNRGIDVTQPPYSAAGDGSTDDIAAIQDAIDAAAASAGSKVVYLPAGTFRTSDWIDIDGVDDLTIRGAGKQATIIKPVDGADCGGFRVGNTTACNRVVIEGVGFDGNQATMTDAVKRLDGFVFDNAADCVLRDFYATQTHPYHEHNTGGSGVSLRANATGIIVEQGLIDDIGDRGIQMAGSGHIIRHNVIRNGYDRGVSLDIYLPGDTWDGADACKIHDNVFSDLSDGSCIAAFFYAASRNSVQNNRMLGTFRGAVQFDNDDASHNLIEGNYVRHGASNDQQQDCFLIGPYGQIIGNVVFDDAGGTLFDRIVEVNTGAAHVLIQGNYIVAGGNPTSGLISVNGPNNQVVDNTILDWGAGDAGVAIAVATNGTGGYRIHGNKGHTDNAAESWIKLGNGNGVLTSNYLSDHFAPSASFSVGEYDITGTVDLSAGNYPTP